MSTNKEKIAQALRDTAEVLRAVTAERDDLRTKVASMERRQEAEKVAHIMIDKGLTSEPVEHVITSLENMAKQGKLASVKQALDFVGPDMARKMAQVNDDSTVPTVGGSDLERYLAGLIH